MSHRKDTLMGTIGRRDLLLLLIGLDFSSAEAGFGGVTRIQKLLYLLDVEEGIAPRVDGYNFEAYKAGPYSPRIYDDLEFLENLDYIRRSASNESITSTGNQDEVAIGDLEVSAEASEPEKAEMDLTFDQLMGPQDVIALMPDEVAPTADSYEEARYCLTERGKKRVEELLEDPGCKPFVDGIRRIKSKFSRHSLNDLLYYVYTRHPGMTTESEIKEKVLRRRPA